MELRKEERVPNVLTIAGIDPSGGAGLLADVKAMSALGVYAAGVPTALTAQNTRGVTGVQAITPEFVRAELEAVFSDLAIDAVKIGMLNDSAVIGEVAGALRKYRLRWVVLDPVMVAKSGDRLLRADALDALRRVLLPCATLITPNIPEALDLLDLPENAITTRETMSRAARALQSRFGVPWVLVKGGHLTGEESPDCLAGPGNALVWFEGKRTPTKNTHGTGCTLSSSIAARLAYLNDVAQAIQEAKEYLSVAIAHADELNAGGGHGPVHHFWSLWNATKCN
ncbi:bifunctional hydroxymethylpyrimidine kinase/phosphomethylpyrimidine kinase [Sutterella sp.]|uniref:bifunctional hydroxymethylpyrimidine kinase/phosphomethylpyrimidine kinase n=1 Tax=Sutterella sp. TaxID=1981025 RepID=UPI0026DF6BF5|nr:bifunctional hydroxymethylpyrimidine kinase/phosphomethylpyrimidine kinase [Sutterella sp.]MDO5531035.1 bifunctional hydroxymethylpyrimidine kinase/phosphomethylpyrimidine kinase [Sutterella sp.]